MKINNLNARKIEYKTSPSQKEAGKIGEQNIQEVFTPTSEEKEWTFLVYLDATKFHDKLAFYKLKELENIGSNEKINIVAEVTRDHHLLDRLTKDREGTTRYYVTKGEHKKISDIAHLYIPGHTHSVQSPPVEEMPLKDIGDPKTFEDFLEWGIKNYPAKHYGVIISSPGAGLEGVMSNNKDNLTLPELGEALKGAEASTGEKINLMVLDQNNSATLETASELTGKVDYLVGSEGQLKGAKIPLSKSISSIKKGLDEEGTIVPKDAAMAFIYESGHQKYGSITTPALSALDLSKTEEVNKLLKDFTSAIGKHPDQKIFRQLIDKSQQFYNNSGRKDFFDLKDFISIISKDTDKFDPQIHELAKKLDNALGKMIVANFHEGELFDKAQGISIYGPTKKSRRTNHILNEVYPTLEMNKETGWNEFIKSIAKDSKFYNFLSSLGVGNKEFKVLEKFLNIAGKTFNIGVGIGSIGLGLSCLKYVLDGPLFNAPGKAITLALGAGQIAYGAKNAYLNFGQDETKNIWQKMADPVFYTAEGIAITSTISLPAKILGEAGKNIAQSIAAAGGVYYTFKGIHNIFSAVNDKDLINKKEKIIDNSLETMRGLAVISVTLGILMSLGAGITVPAGIAAAAIPVARVIYNMLNNLKDLKEEDVDLLSFKEKLEQIPLLSSTKASHYIPPAIAGMVEQVGEI